MHTASTDPALIGSIVTSLVAVGIALASNWRDNKLRRKDWAARERMEAAARERADLSQAALVTCVYFIPRIPTKSSSLVIAVSNSGNDPILDLKLEADGGKAEFSLARKTTTPETDVDLRELSHEQWTQMEFFTHNGVPLVHPGKTFAFSVSSEGKALTPNDVIVSFRLLSGNAYGNRGGKLFRSPELDLKVEGSLMGSSIDGFYTHFPPERT